MSLLSWWNLIFILPAFAAVLYVVLMAAGVVVADDIDFAVDPEVELDGPHDLDQVDGPSGGWGLLSLLGIGKAPLSILLICFGLLWGVAGLISNAVLAPILTEPGRFIWPAMVIAVLVAAGLTRLLASGLGRIMPSNETYNVSNRQLVGRRAQVRYLVSDDSGTAQLYDEYGRVHEVSVRVQPGEAPIPAQTPVVIWRYDAARNTFLVTPEHEEPAV